MSRWLERLNPGQREAVLHDLGPLLILAGAGTGKTTVLVARAGRLIDEGKTKAENLNVLTFTNKAARELKNRVAKKLGPKAQNLWAGTFHSFGLKLLRKYHKEAGLLQDFGVLDPTDAVAVSKEILKGFKFEGKEAFDVEALLSLLGQWREDGRGEAKNDDPYEIAAEWLLPKLEKRYAALGVVDFDGLILKPIALMETHPKIYSEIQERVHFLMVDEFQDTNRTQMKFVRLLSEKNRNLAVVGDDDQSIYGWRGACIENILNFSKKYKNCKIVRLEQNYRSVPQVLDVANAVISKNKERLHKKLYSTVNATIGTIPEILVAEDENEEVECVSAEIQELVREGIPLSQIAVLYRANGQGAFLEAELRKQGTPYAITGGTAFFDRKETRDILAYLRSSLRPNDLSIRRILNVPSRGIGENTIEKLTLYSSSHGTRFLNVLKKWKEAGVEERAGRAIDSFFSELSGLVPKILAPSGDSFGQALVEYFEAIGYRKYIEKTSSKAVAAQNRWKLIEIFGQVMEKYLQRNPSERGLLDFLEAMELRDLPEDAEKSEKVQLLTLHACKGLEWDAVIFMGVEEDLIPHKSLGSDLAEERRLFYVGVTRARRKLLFTRAKSREKNGKRQPAVPSRFLQGVPSHLIKERSGRRVATKEQRRALLEAFYRELDGAL